MQFNMFALPMLLASILQASGLDESTSVRVYFGNGCFFAHQNLFIEGFERKVLNRTDANLSAIAGYAGSPKTGPRGAACYHNPSNFSDYGRLGHAEAVEVEVPFKSLDAAFAVYFDSFVQVDKGLWSRFDFYDQGAEYRSLLGVPGGIKNDAVMEAVRRSNVHNLTLLPGQGSDPDTFFTNTVFVMDSLQYPFIQAELCLQFHDDSQAKYGDSYHALRKGFERSGRVVSTVCPPNNICNSTKGSFLEALTVMI